MNRVRCVIDTNVFISAALKPGGFVNALFAAVLEDGTLLISDALLEEYRTRLARPKFDPYLTEAERRQIVNLVEHRGAKVSVQTDVDDSLDPDDNAILALAIDGRADVIVTGDKKHLLPLHPYRGIPVLTPRDVAKQFLPL